MPPAELDPILIQVTVPLPIPMILAGFTDPDKLSGWLCASARVDPRIGGVYELTFTDPEPFTSHGRVTHFTPDVDIGYSWEPPSRFTSLMSGPGRSSSVYVRLQDSPEGIDVTLEHVGWGAGDAWEEARSWHFQLWDERLRRFKEYLLKAAYG